MPVFSSYLGANMCFLDSQVQMERKFVPGIIPNPIILDLGNLNEIWDF